MNEIITTIKPVLDLVDPVIAFIVICVSVAFFRSMNDYYMRRKPADRAVMSVIAFTFCVLAYLLSNVVQNDFVSALMFVMSTALVLSAILLPHRALRTILRLRLLRVLK